MKSVAEQITQLATIAPGRLTRWEADFIVHAVNFTRPGAMVEAMSPREVEIVGRLYRKHFSEETA